MRPAAPHRREPRLQRASAGVLATLFVAGQLAGFVHRALVAHVTCPEHGEVIHSRVERGASVHDHAPPCMTRDSAPRGAHEHDVCLVVLHQRTSVVTSTAPAMVPSPPPPERAQERVTAVSFAPQSVYRLAPKTSPPV